MKKTIKILLIVGVILTLVIAGTVVIYNSVNHNTYEKSYKKVSKFVDKNREDIESIVQKVKAGKDDYYSRISYKEDDYQDWASAKEIIILMDKININYVRKEENDITFEMDELASSGTGYGICGFYYSFNNKPISLWFDGTELKRYGRIWKVVFHNESYCKMERIEKNIFFYDGAEYF